MVNKKVNSNQNLPKSPFPYWLSFSLLHPWRKIVVQRERFVRKAGIGVGNTVFELGCGPGFFTEYIAKVVGENGLVYAQDVQPQILQQLKNRMKNFAVSENIKPLLVSSTQTGLPGGSVDVVFAANVFEEIEKENLLEKTAIELKRVLKKDKHITVIEHRFGVGKKRFQKIIAALESNGFKPVRQRITPFMYFAWLEAR